MEKDSWNYKISQVLADTMRQVARDLFGLETEWIFCFIKTGLKQSQ